MQEEPDREARIATAQQCRHEHQVEVVDPHPAPRLGVLEDDVRETLVHLDVPRPRLGSDPEPVREVVEQRPERVVADPVVEVLLLARGEENRREIVTPETLPDAPLVVGRDDGAGPADPARLAADGLQRYGETAGARRHLDAVVGQREANRQAVAGDDEPVLTAMTRQVHSFEAMAGRYNLRFRE